MDRMKETFITCALCGHTYSLEAHQGCVSCPLELDCNIICCPACGFSDVDPNKSKAVGWLRSKVFARKGGTPSHTSASGQVSLSVADLLPGMQAIILSLQAVDERRREQLMSYGLAPGRCVYILQHNPATILQVDQTELAIEEEVARQILVHAPHQIGRRSLRRYLGRKHRRKRRRGLRRWRGHRRADEE